jgi:hypothetical protein
MGTNARDLVAGRWSIKSMVSGYEQLIKSTYVTKMGTRPAIAVNRTASQ